MSIKFTRKDISRGEVQYLVEGHGIGLRVTAGGIDVLGGAPAFDTKAEERVWNQQVDVCILLQRLMKQGAKELPSEESLLALAMSAKEPE
jgi:hypothetical protein